MRRKSTTTRTLPAGTTPAARSTPTLQHSNTALYEKPGDLSAEIKPDFSGGFSSNKAEVGTVSVRLDLMVRIRAAVMKLMMNSNYNKTEI